MGDTAAGGENAAVTLAYHAGPWFADGHGICGGRRIRSPLLLRKRMDGEVPHGFGGAVWVGPGGGAGAGEGLKTLLVHCVSVGK